MKKLPFLLLAALLTAGLSVERLQAETPDFENLSLPELVGIVFAVSTGISELDFDEAEQEALLSGMKTGLKGQVSQEDLMLVMPRIQNFLQERFAAVQAREAEANKEAGEAFLASLDGNEAVVRTESGLRYEILRQGEGPFATLTDRVLVDYHGTLIDGTVFDSSRDRGEPVPFPLDGVIPGFSEGLTKIGEGGLIRLYIPSDLAYGDEQNPGSPIPPGSTLIFEAELVQINPPQPQRPQMPRPTSPPPTGDIPPPPSGADIPPPPTTPPPPLPEGN